LRNIENILILAYISTKSKVRGRLSYVNKCLYISDVEVCRVKDKNGLDTHVFLAVNDDNNIYYLINKYMLTQIIHLEITFARIKF